MIIRSEYLIDEAARITEDASLRICGDRIVEIKAGKEFFTTWENVLDLGEYSFLLPGLVNAHAHLELTLLRDQMPERLDFTDWIRGVIRITRSWPPNCFSHSLREGIKESLAAGTTALGDIHGQADCGIYSDHPLRTRVFFEVIDFNPETADATADSLEEQMNALSEHRRLAIGVSPHTPYTVSDKLLRKCAALTRDKNLPLCIHISETAAEEEFLQLGTGDILGFRKQFGLPDTWKAPGKSAVQYIQHLGVLDQPAVLVHANYVNENDMDIIAASGSSVVFCPRSHRYFHHSRHAVKRMLEKGINVALGTDSLASSPSLSVLEEMKTLKEDYPEIRSDQVLKMATVNGLRALSLPRAAGLQPNHLADLTAIKVAPDDIECADNPLDAVFSRSARVVLSMIDGKIVFQANHETPALDGVPQRE